MTTPTLEHRFSARGAGLDVFRRKDSEVLLSGPAGTGKSRACLEKLHQLALRNPGMRGLIMRKTMVSLPASALKTWREDVVCHALLDGSVSFHGGGPQDPPQYRYSNGSTIAIGGMDKPSRIMSTEYDVIYVQEATELTEEEWEAATTRLRNGRLSFQQMVADCNPDHPAHWLKARAERGQTTMLESRHEDNPRYFNADGSMTQQGKAYIAKLDALTGVRYERLRLGLWAASEGVIYDSFDRALHLIDRFEVPNDWTRYWSIDFGYTNPFVWQDWAEDPDGRLYLVREIYRTQRIVEDHVASIKAMHTDASGRWCGPRPKAIICDHDAEDRATFTRHMGMDTVAANKNVSEGIQAFTSRLKLAGDGRPRIFILRGSVVELDGSLKDAKKPTCTAEEIPSYVWDAAKDKPVKANDHGCDAGRYLVAHVDLQPKYGMRWL